MAFKRAKVCAFYGWTHDYVNNLSVDVFQDYWLAMDGIEGERVLAALNISAYPHWKNSSARKKIFKYAENMRDGCVEKPRDRDLVTTESIFQKLTGKFGEWQKKTDS